MQGVKTAASTVNEPIIIGSDGFVKDGYNISGTNYHWNGTSLSDPITGTNEDVFLANMNTSNSEKDVAGIGININTNTINVHSIIFCKVSLIIDFHLGFDHLLYFHAFL